jgi:hypothetical protein
MTDQRSGKRGSGAKIGKVGTVYLLHFGRPYHHARHYVGFAGNLNRRLREHRRGIGSPLVYAVVQAGIEVFVARLWENVTRGFERRLHRIRGARRGSRFRCPICAGPPAFQRALPRRDPRTGIGT